MLKFFGPDSEWLWSMIQALSVIISLPFIYYQLKSQRESLSMEKFSELHQRWNSPDLLKARFYVCEVASQGNPNLEISNNEGLILDFFEELGLYQSKKLLNVNDVWELYSYYIENYWHLLKPNVYEFRINDNHTWYNNAEKLYNISVKISNKKGVKYPIGSNEKFEKFIQSELDINRT